MRSGTSRRAASIASSPSQTSPHTSQFSAVSRRRSAVRLSDDLRAPSLHVYVTAFDEAFAPTHAAVVEATATLRDASGRLLLDRRFSAESAITADDPALMARAMGAALDEVAAGMADAVAAAVAAPATPAHRKRR